MCNQRLRNLSTSHFRRASSWPCGRTTPPASESKKVAIITGASQGIGAGLVEAYGRAGYAVVGTSRSISSSDEPGFLTVPGDITHVDTAQRVVDEATGRFGRIDSLINNAGLFIGKPFEEYTPDDFAAVTAVNVTGFFHITQRAVSPSGPGARYLRCVALDDRALAAGGRDPPVAVPLVDLPDRS